MKAFSTAVALCVIIALTAVAQANPEVLDSHSNVARSVLSRWTKSVETLQKRGFSFRELQTANITTKCTTANLYALALRPECTPVSSFLGLDVNTLCSTCSSYYAGLTDDQLSCLAETLGALSGDLIAALMRVMCLTDANNATKKCGEFTKDLLTDQTCSILLDRYTCNLSPLCAWRNSACHIAGGSLPLYCSSCLQTYYAYAIKYTPASYIFEDKQGILLLSKALCVNSGSTNCAAALGVYDFDASTTYTVITQQASTSCSNSVKATCSQLILNGLVPAARYIATAAYYQCVQTVYPSTICAARWRNQNSQLYIVGSVAPYICSQSSSGDYCARFLNPNDNATQCIATIASGYSCTSSCSSILNTALSRLGCCAQIVALVASGAVPLSVSAATLPTLPSKIIAAPSTISYGYPSAPTPTTSGLTALTLCSSITTTALATALAQPICTLPVSDLTVNRTLLVKVPWSTVVYQKATYEAALTADIAAALTLPVASIRGSISENALFLVTVGTTAHKMRALATATGTQFTFTIQTSSDATTTAAASAFDTTASAILLPNTASTYGSSGADLSGGSASGAASMTAASILALAVAMLAVILL